MAKNETTDGLAADNSVFEYEDGPDSPLPSKHTSSKETPTVLRALRQVTLEMRILMSQSRIVMSYFLHTSAA